MIKLSTLHKVTSTSPQWQNVCSCRYYIAKPNVTSPIMPIHHSAPPPPFLQWFWCRNQTFVMWSTSWILAGQQHKFQRFVTSVRLLSSDNGHLSCDVWFHEYSTATESELPTSSPVSRGRALWWRGKAEYKVIKWTLTFNELSVFSLSSSLSLSLLDLSRLVGNLWS